jgi:hypothetical protein
LLSLGKLHSELCLRKNLSAGRIAPAIREDGCPTVRSDTLSYVGLPGRWKPVRNAAGYSEWAPHRLVVPKEVVFERESLWRRQLNHVRCSCWTCSLDSVRMMVVGSSYAKEAQGHCRKSCNLKPIPVRQTFSARPTAHRRAESDRTLVHLWLT